MLSNQSECLQCHSLLTILIVCYVKQSIEGFSAIMITRYVGDKFRFQIENPVAE